MTTYWMTHQHLPKWRGKASAQWCATPGCERKALDWSYDYTDPAPLTQVINGRARPYSLDLSRYVALCRSCHRRHDYRMKVSWP